jgi:hypothetical protein
MNNEDALQRQTNINIQLRRQLEQCRKDTVEYCAKFCEDHAVTYCGTNGATLEPAIKVQGFDHSGKEYAEGLRRIIGK